MPDVFVTKMNVCNEDERSSAANPHAAKTPAIAVPETLALPVAAAVIVVGDIGRTAVIAVTRTVVAWSVSVIARTGERAADNGAADNSGSDTCANSPLRMGRCGCGHGGNSESGDGSKCHQCLLHGVTFLIRGRGSGQAVRRG